MLGLIPDFVPSPNANSNPNLAFDLAPNLAPGPESESAGIGGILQSLAGQCVKFQLVSGAVFTGVIRGVENGAVRITMGSRTVWVVINKIDRFQPTESGAC